MTKSGKMAQLFLGVFLLMALPWAQAQNTPGTDNTSNPKWHSGQHFGEIYSQLNLTDDQKRQLDANKSQHRARNESERQELKAQKQLIQEELMKPVLDMPQVMKIHHQIKFLLSQMEDDKLNSILAVRAILTPEQFTKFVNLMHRHKQEHAN